MFKCKLKLINCFFTICFISGVNGQALVNFLGHWTGTEALESPSMIYENRNISLVIEEGGDRDGFFIFTSSSDFLFNDNLDWAYHYIGYDKESDQLLFLRRFITPLGILGYEQLVYELTEWSTEYFVAEYHSEERQTDHQMRLDIQLLKAIGYTPSRIQLGKNYPNPFNPSTTISLSADGDYSGVIVIYDIKGKEVRTLHDGKFQTGSSQFTWDGLNEYGNQISGGIYFCHLVLNGVHAQTIKMTFIK